MNTPADRLLEADARAREQALAPDSFIVEAPAGAGKTELLTQRYLRLLAGVAEPEEIVALTFTNKAAAEMRARIRASLERAARDEAPALPHQRITFELARAALAADRARGWGLLAHPGRLQITTLDALCARLARQMPLLSRFGGQPAVREDCAPHYRRAAEDTLALLEGDDEHAERVADALAYFDNDAGRLRALLVAMLGKRDQWSERVVGDGFGERASSALAASVRGDLAEIVALVDARLQAGVMAAARVAADNVIAGGGASGVAALRDWTRPLTADPAELERWRGLADLLLTREGKPRKRLDPTFGLTGSAHADSLKQACAELDADAAGALARVRALPAAALDADELRIIEVFHDLLRLAAAQLWLVFQASGEVDFIGIAQNALAALGDVDAPTALRERLDYRIGHLLIDEFQDTSPLQMALVERLTADWQAGDGRTLFLVGDPMQSIYRFRKADVGLFLKVRADGVGAGMRPQPLRLYRNNRSADVLVDWVNRVFPGVLAGPDDIRLGQVRFAAAAATRGALAGAGVITHPVLARDGEDGDALEARELVGLLRAARRELPAGERIAVLTRARNHLEPLLAELRRQAPELRFRAVELEPLAERQVVQDLAALTRALHHRADRVNQLAILRAPWCGLRLADLHALAADDHRATVPELMRDPARLARLSEDGRRRLAHARACLDEADAWRGRMRPRRWVEGVWRLLGGPLCLREPGEALDAAAFFDLLDRIEIDGRLDLDRLDEAIAGLRAAPDPAADDAIEMMTVHKSKGLEFDTVILPGLHLTTRGPEQNLLIWDEVVLDDGRRHLLAAPVKRRGAGGDLPSAYDYLSGLERTRTENEARRVLYVAVTRARRRLHLVGVARVDAEDGLRMPTRGTPLALLWDALGAEFEARLEAESEVESASADAGRAESGQAPETSVPIDPAAYAPPLCRLAEPGVPPALAVPTPDQAGTGEPTPAAGADLVASLEADLGTLLHRCLEWIARDGVAAWSDTRLAALEPAWRAWLSRRGHAAADARRAAARARAGLAATLDSEDGRWLLRPRPGAGAELAVSGADVTGIVDRVFDEDGTRWIVDYKTTALDPDTPDAMLRELAESHRPQLERYARLLGEPGLDIALAIHFVAIGRLVRLADGA